MFGGSDGAIAGRARSHTGICVAAGTGDHCRSSVGAGSTRDGGWVGGGGFGMFGVSDGAIAGRARSHRELAWQLGLVTTADPPVGAGSTRDGG